MRDITDIFSPEGSNSVENRPKSIKGGNAAMPDYNKPVANPLVVLREEFDDWAILFDPDTGNAFGLNPTSVYIWKRLDGHHKVGDILKELCENAEGVPEEAEEHLKEFIGDLVKKGLAGYEITT
jgi:SynChlorMet cassette protein ScmD